VHLEIVNEKDYAASKSSGFFRKQNTGEIKLQKPDGAKKNERGERTGLLCGVSFS
jgi:hypothetical protein